MKVVILKDAAAVARYGADIFINHINQKPDSVLGLATGSTPVALYKELIAAYETGRVSFKNVSSFNLDEYLGLPSTHPQSYRYFMNQQLFDHVDIDKTQTHVPAGDAEDPFAACEAYEKNIKQKGGAIALLTQNKLSRSSVYHQALILAMIPFLNKELF